MCDKLSASFALELGMNNVVAIDVGHLSIDQIVGKNVHGQEKIQFFPTIVFVHSAMELIDLTFVEQEDMNKCVCLVEMMKIHKGLKGLSK